MRTIVILCLIAGLMLLAWKFELWWFVDEILNTFRGLGAIARDYYP